MHRVFLGALGINLVSDWISGYIPAGSYFSKNPDPPLIQRVLKDKIPTPAS
jgi:hypothetical protein